MTDTHDEVPDEVHDAPDEAAADEPEEPAEPLDPDDLTAGEQMWNYNGLRTRLLDETDAASSRLVLKCIDPELGGIVHGDGLIVWDDLEDRDYLEFVAWIEAGL